MRAAEVVELRDDRRRAWRGIVRARSAFSYRGGNSAPVVLSHDWAELRSIWRGSPNPLSGDGFVVAAVDHHGNSSVEEVLPEGVRVLVESGAADVTVVVDHLLRRRIRSSPLACPGRRRSPALLSLLTTCVRHILQNLQAAYAARPRWPGLG